MARFRRGPTVVGLLLTCILAACGQSVKEVPPVATSEEYRIFAEQPIVVVRVEFNRLEDAHDVIKSYEAIKLDYTEKYMLLTPSLEDFKTLRTLAFERNFVITIDMAKTLEQTNRVALKETGQIQGIPGYNCYCTLEKTHKKMELFAAAYPDLVRLEDIGDSWQKTQQETPRQGGYDIFVLVLGNKFSTGDKPKTLITSALHPREYATAELTIRFAEHLLENYGNDADVTWLLDHQELHLIIQANPDGRKAAEGGVLWRKNGNSTHCGGVSRFYGADLNRNFSFAWGRAGAGDKPCTETYRGSHAASEPETQAIQNYLKKLFPDKRKNDFSSPAPEDTAGLYLDIHSFGELILWPWGVSRTLAPNHNALQTLGRKLAYFNNYTPEQAIGLRPTSGTSIDFAYGELGVPAYTLEVGSDFFQDCDSFTQKIIPENFPALLYAMKSSRAPYQLPSGPDVTGLASTVSDTFVALEANVSDRRYNRRSGQEKSQNITEAEFYIDIPPWLPGAVAQPMSASDGNFNEGLEGVQATFDTRSLSAGQHIIYIRAKDSANHWGVMSAIFVNSQ
ncbi:MAG: M14 family metallopeptidase [Trueperaceae bacterium]